MHVTIELTKDPELLHQYYELRERSFQDKLGIAQFDGTEEELDKSSDILVARIGDRCIGGVRICGVDDSDKLPLEDKAGYLEQKLPTLDMQDAGLCQWMRFTLCPEMDIPIAYIQDQFMYAAAQISKALGYKYGFCVSSRIHHRYYKRALSRFGYDYWDCGDVTVDKKGEFDDLEHLLYMTDLHSGIGESKIINPVDVTSTFHLNLKEQRSLYVCQH
jgi:hypothetical protein